MYNRDQPGTPVLRGTGDRKKKDRAPVVRYGARGHERSTGMSRGEEMLLEPPSHLKGRDRYLMGTIPSADSHIPLSTRQSVASVLIVSMTQGADILVDQNNSIDHEVRALFAHFALRSGRDLLLSGAPVTRRLSRERQLIEFRQHVGQDRLQRSLELLFEAAGPQLAQAISDHGVIYRLLQVTGEPLRNMERATGAAEALRALGWNQVRIRRYLTLHGFANTSGTIGVWNHSEFKKLGA